jgi:hypothetical protein
MEVMSVCVLVPAAKLLTVSSSNSTWYILIKIYRCEVQIFSHIDPQYSLFYMLNP